MKYSIPCVFCLFKVVSHYDFSVLSMLVMGFQKKFEQEGGWDRLYPVFS